MPFREAVSNVKLPPRSYALRLLVLVAVCAAGCGGPEEPPPPPDTAGGPSAEAPSSLSRYREHPRVLSAIGEASRLVLEAPDDMVVHAVVPDTYREFGYAGLLDPEALAKALTLLDTERGVHGTLVVENPRERDVLVGGLYASLVDPGPSAGCYDPRHALVAARGEERVVVFFCFACHYVVVIDASGAGRYTTGGAQDALQAYLNDRLDEAGIPVDGR